MQNFFFLACNILNQKISRLSSLFLAVTLAVLSGCGGGGGGGGGGGPDPTGATGTTPAATGTPAATVPDVNGTTASSSQTNAPGSTVTGQSLFVRLSTDLTVASSSPLSNVKQYIATVTDSADSGGHPVPGIEVQFALRPGHYFTGSYSAAPPPSTSTDPVTGVVSTTIGRATQSVTARCANEDTDFSGIIDANKDLNQNGQLDPGGVTTKVPNATTDANGIAAARITYPKTHATWVEVILEARAGVAVNDFPAFATFILPGVIAEYEFGGPSSSASISPYGAIGVPPACVPQ